MEPGEMINFTEADQIVIKAEQEQHKGTEALIHLLGHALARDGEAFWRSIRDLHPELADLDFIIDHVGQTFVVLGPRKRADE